MKVLGSAVLAFEWIVLALAIPVAVNTAGVPAPSAWAVFGVASGLTLAALALIGRPIGVWRGLPAGVWLGWGVQVVAVASGLVVPALGILGLVFAGLYFAAIRSGARVDRIRATRTG